MADIINFPSLRNPDRRYIDLANIPTSNAGTTLSEDQRRGQVTDEEREVMFGKLQFQAR